MTRLKIPTTSIVVVLTLVGHTESIRAQEEPVSAPASPVVAQAEPVVEQLARGAVTVQTCCRCKNNIDGDRHKFESHTCSDEGEWAVCSVTPSQCRTCDAVDGESPTGCHAEYSDPGSEFSCNSHPSCAPAFLSSLPYPRELKDGLMALGADRLVALLQANGAETSVVVHIGRRALQVLGCDGVSVVAHFPISDVQLAAVVSEMPVALASRPSTAASSTVR